MGVALSKEWSGAPIKHCQEMEENLPTALAIDLVFAPIYRNSYRLSCLLSQCYVPQQNQVRASNLPLGQSHLDLR
jgi:hypothetical protein